MCHNEREKMTETNRKKPRMENMKHRLSQTTFCKALVLLALVAAVALPVNVQAQRDEEIAGESSTLHYTLSNGLFEWLEGPEESPHPTPVLLDGSSYGYRTRPAAQSLSFEASVAQLLIHILAVMGGDVDEGRIELAQFLDVGKQPLCASPLQWGQHFE